MEICTSKKLNMRKSAIKRIYVINVSSPDDALGSILVKTTKLGRHVGECSQAVGVEILILLGTETQADATLLHV